MLCCGYTLTDFPTSIRLTLLALWQSNDCPSASKATLMNMDKCYMWIHYERLHNHNKAKHNKTVCIFLGIYCILEDINTSQPTYVCTVYFYYVQIIIVILISSLLSGYSAIAWGKVMQSFVGQGSTWIALCTDVLDYGDKALFIHVEWFRNDIGVLSACVCCR